MTVKLTYSVAEFAKIMKVPYATARWWARNGKIPGAFQQGGDELTVQRWRIPREAVTMERPKRGAPKGPRGTKYYSKAAQIEELRAELADLNERHIVLLGNYASLLGKYEKVEAELIKVTGKAPDDLSTKTK